MAPCPRCTRFRYCSRISCLSRWASSRSAHSAWVSFPPQSRSAGLTSRASCIVIVDAPETTRRCRRLSRIARATAATSMPRCSKKRRSSTARKARRRSGSMSASGIHRARLPSAARVVRSTTPLRSSSVSAGAGTRAARPAGSGIITQPVTSAIAPAPNADASTTARLTRCHRDPCRSLTAASPSR